MSWAVRRWILKSSCTGIGLPSIGRVEAGIPPFAKRREARRRGDFKPVPASAVCAGGEAKPPLFAQQKGDAERGDARGSYNPKTITKRIERNHNSPKHLSNELLKIPNETFRASLSRSCVRVYDDPPAPFHSQTAKIPDSWPASTNCWHPHSKYPNRGHSRRVFKLLKRNLLVKPLSLTWQ